MKIQQYLNQDYITDICSKTNMPCEVVDSLISLIPTLDLCVLNELYEKLINSDTMHEAAAYMEETLVTQKNGQFICLILYLAATGYAHEFYVKKGIPDKIYYDTMDCFREYVQTYYNAHGVWGFDVITWPIRHIHGLLFECGRLGFEMRTFDFETIFVDDKPILKTGDPILSVHIPANGKLNHDDCLKAYQTAREFFKEYYPDYNAKYFFCCSWLLYPAVKKMLSPDSNIYKFQNDYTIFMEIENTAGAIPRIFGKAQDDINAYKTDTSLRKNIVSYLKEGKALGEGAGYFKI